MKLTNLLLLMLPSFFNQTRKDYQCLIKKRIVKKSKGPDNDEDKDQSEVEKEGETGELK